MSDQGITVTLGGQELQARALTWGQFEEIWPLIVAENRTAFERLEDLGRIIQVATQKTSPNMDAAWLKANATIQEIQVAGEKVMEASGFKRAPPGEAVRP